ncbi:MAG: HTH domain-containing protein [Faecalibacterium prausnitzii]
MGAVYREELSANARKLIEQLLSLPQGWVTAAALAESIGVSRRTVLRELPAVEQWMQAAWDASSYRRVVSCACCAAVCRKRNWQRCSADGCRKTRSSRPCWIQKRPKRSGRFCSSLNRKSSSICRMQAFWRWRSIAP